jgi:hypothetical protein
VDWILHNPPNMPSWLDADNTPQAILKRSVTQKSLEYCKGLFVLSEYCKDWLSKQVDVPVNSLIHPTEVPTLAGGPKRFTMRSWQLNPDKKIVALGYWLRQLQSIKLLPTEKYTKFWSIPAKKAKEMYKIEVAELGAADIIGNYTESGYISNDEYDSVLSSNIAFVHLYDASACNSLIECIVRNTPILINPIPSVVERLGGDYPFYFTSLEEAAKKAEDEGLVAEAHKYLLSLDKYIYTQEHFLTSFQESEIYGRCI